MFRLSKSPCCKKLTRTIHSSQRLLMEPVSKKKTDVAEAGLKHPLVTCEAVWTCCSGSPPVSSPKPRVVIVGAGVAGLSAASKLIKAGIDDVVVVEALGRPGGRVHTCYMNDTPVDLGASEMYGKNITNPMFNMAVMEQLLDEDLEKKQMVGPYYTTDGVILYDISKPYNIFEKVIQDTARIFSSSKRSNQSVKEFISPKLQEAVETYSSFDRPEEILLIMSGLENEVRVRWGDDLSNMSADYLGSFVEIPDGVIKMTKGSGRLLQPLLATVGSKIKYKKPVQSIRWGTRFIEGSKRGSVLCCDGEEISCDFIICTVSLGVLKAQAETLFSPPLPKSKLESITNLSFGHIAKIYLEYDKPFWAPGEGVIKVGWNPQELQKREDWIKGIGSVEEVSNTILRVCIAGRESIWTENCSDKTIAEDITMFLRKLIGDPSLPCPKRITRSKWSSDIYFMGALTYMGLQSSVEQQCKLMSPLPDTLSVPPVLLFAGEATAPGHFSTMHGAMLSGYREADRIIGISEKYSGFPMLQKVKKKVTQCS